MSYIRPFSFKYHTKIAFCTLRPLRGRFPIDLISLLKQGFKTLGSDLSTILRGSGIIFGAKCGLWACKLPYYGTMTSNSQIPGYGWILCAPEQKSPILDWRAMTPSMVI